MSERVECRIAGSFPINPAPVVNNGLTAPFPGMIYDGFYLEVPRSAQVVSQVLTDAAGGTPAATALPGETWSVVHEGRPDAKWHSFGYGLGADPWLVMLEVKGLSTKNPSARPFWHWTVTYVLPLANACPKGGIGPQPVAVNGGSVQTTTAPLNTTTTAIAPPVVYLKQEPGGRVSMRIVNPAVAVALGGRVRVGSSTDAGWKILPPPGHTVTSIKGSSGLSCSNEHSSAKCTPEPSTGVPVESLIGVIDLYLSPAIKGTLKDRVVTTKGTTTVDLISATPTAAAVSTTTLVASLDALDAKVARTIAALKGTSWSQEKAALAALSSEWLKLAGRYHFPGYDSITRKKLLNTVLSAGVANATTKIHAGQYLQLLRKGIRDLKQQLTTQARRTHP